MAGGPICSSTAGHTPSSAWGTTFSLRAQLDRTSTQEPDGTFSGVFYQQGTAQEIALYHLDQAKFTYFEGRLVYFDGLRMFYMPENYSVGEDGLAYDQDGNLFAAGFDFTPLDPAELWGPDWADNWG